MYTFITVISVNAITYITSRSAGFLALARPQGAALALPGLPRPPAGGDPSGSGKHNNL